jgi:hypothetical protein
VSAQSPHGHQPRGACRGSRSAAWDSSSVLGLNWVCSRRIRLRGFSSGSSFPLGFSPSEVFSRHVRVRCG